MKKIVFAVLVLCTMGVSAQPLIQSSSFTGQIVPRFAGSGTSTRLAVVHRSTLSGLAPNTTYRYFTNLATRADFGTTNSGAGNPLFVRATSTTSYTTAASLVTAGGYDSLTTDNNGSYTGWFSTVTTGNARFTAGNYVFPTIVLDSAGSKRGVVNTRFALADSIQVLSYSATAGANNASFLRGNSFGTPKNLVLLYSDTTSGSRPLSIGFIEGIGVTIASLVTDYTNNVQGVVGAWGVTIPNTLPTGVLKIEQRSISTGQVLNSHVSSTGSWGTVNTVNPTFGTTGAVILAANAPLPVRWISFNGQVINGQTVLNWVTASELNNAGFEIERSIDGENFEQIAFVKGSGTTSTVSKYEYIDYGTSKAYYRLKQLDFDGQFDYSSVVKVGEDIALQVAVSPNPFIDVMNVNSNELIESIEVMDIMGKVYFTAKPNTLNHKLTLDNIHTEVYVVRITSGGKTTNKWVVKQ